MKVKELKEKLKEFDDDQDVVIYGCYASEGDILEISEEKWYSDKKCCAIFSDICSG